MQLTEHFAGDVNVIRSFDERGVRVGDDLLPQSVLLSAGRMEYPWPYARVSELDETAALFALDWKPDVILIGSGEVLEFPPGSFVATLVNAGVGYETMTRSAACRTYNVLLSEERAVILALIQTT